MDVPDPRIVILSGAEGMVMKEPKASDLGSRSQLLIAA